MEISLEKKGTCGIIRLAGKLTAVEAPELEQEVRQLAGKDGLTCLLIDLKDLEYISSAGLRVFLLGAKMMDAKGGRVLLCALRENVREVFDISGFTDLFGIYGAEEEALASCES